MRKVLRLVMAGILAAGITFCIFLFMHWLISSGGVDSIERKSVATIRFGPVEIPDDVATRSRRKPREPPPPENPPRLPKMPLERPNPPEQNIPRIHFPELDIPLVAGEGMFLGSLQPPDQAAEGDVIPVVVIRPLYPREAAVSGIEGWVKLEFTITEAGTVKDPMVVDSSPSRIFNREAIRAILKWKFKPRVIDGVAVERRATQVIDFSLDGQ